MWQIGRPLTIRESPARRKETKRWNYFRIGAPRVVEELNIHHCWRTRSSRRSSASMTTHDRRCRCASIKQTKYWKSSPYMENGCGIISSCRAAPRATRHHLSPHPAIRTWRPRHPISMLTSQDKNPSPFASATGRGSLRGAGAGIDAWASTLIPAGLLPDRHADIGPACQPRKEIEFDLWRGLQSLVSPIRFCPSRRGRFFSILFLPFSIPTRLLLHKMRPSATSGRRPPSW